MGECVTTAWSQTMQWRRASWPRRPQGGRSCQPVVPHRLPQRRSPHRSRGVWGLPGATGGWSRFVSPGTSGGVTSHTVVTVTHACAAKVTIAAGSVGVLPQQLMVGRWRPHTLAAHRARPLCEAGSRAIHSHGMLRTVGHGPGLFCVVLCLILHLIVNIAGGYWWWSTRSLAMSLAASWPEARGWCMCMQ